MKKITFVSTSLLVAILLTSSVALAADELPDPGITPDSPFYFLDTAGESINEFFSMSHESKSEKILRHAEEKLAEAKLMVEKDKPDKAEAAELRYERKLTKATDEAKLTGRENALQRIEEATVRHQLVMEKVLSQVPEQAKTTIQKVIDKSTKGHENATNAINKIKKGQ